MIIVEQFFGDKERLQLRIYSECGFSSRGPILGDCSKPYARNCRKYIYSLTAARVNYILMYSKNLPSCAHKSSPEVTKLNYFVFYLLFGPILHDQPQVSNVTYSAFNLSGWNDIYFSLIQYMQSIHICSHFALLKCPRERKPKFGHVNMERHPT